MKKFMFIFKSAATVEIYANDMREAYDKLEAGYETENLTAVIIL